MLTRGLGRAIGERSRGFKCGEGSLHSLHHFGQLRRWLARSACSKHPWLRRSSLLVFLCSLFFFSLSKNKSSHLRRRDEAVSSEVSGPAVRPRGQSLLAEQREALVRARDDVAKEGKRRVFFRGKKEFFFPPERAKEKRIRGERDQEMSR